MALLVGLALHRVAPRRTVGTRRATAVGGLGLLGGSALLVGWSVWTMGRVNVDAPTQLVTDGPYAHSRNPMYVGWTIAYAGVILLVNSLWLLVVFPAVLVATHLVVRGEERSLERAFGDEYRAYRRTVRRYL